MTLRQAFEADPCGFMATHAIGIKAAGASLQALANYDDFQNWNLHGDKSSLTAPSGYAQFKEVNA